ncbi:MAG: hypothetical protein J7L45_03050 [Candidatus Aenigmarchaeota archaeon]|nr:hypothetical protein [Candidatus Aenigmarchaeota archaeon]
MCLLVPVLAEYGKFRKISEKAFNWIAGGGISFILAVAFNSQVVSFWTYAGQISTYLQQLFEFIGWIFVLVGSILALVDLTKK